MAGDSHRAKGQRRPVESSSRCHRANAAAARGDLDELKSIATHRQLRGTRWDEGTFLEAAKNGRVDCLRFLYEQKCDTGTNASIVAARSGHVECLKFLLEEKVGGFAPIPQDVNWDENWLLDDYPIHAHTLEAAAEGGHVECLRLVHESVSMHDSVVYRNLCDATEELIYDAAARYGRLNVFQYMISENRQYGNKIDGTWVSRWSEIVLECALHGKDAPDGARRKYWECVKFLFLARLNLVIDRSYGNAHQSINNQLGYAHRDMIKRTAREIFKSLYAPWGGLSQRISHRCSAWRSLLRVLQVITDCRQNWEYNKLGVGDCSTLLREMFKASGTECEWHPEWTDYVQPYGDRALPGCTLYHEHANFAYVNSRTSRDYCEGLRLHHFAILGQVECMHVMRKRGCPWSPGGVDWEAAIQFENLNVVKFLHKEGCPVALCGDVKSAYLRILELYGSLPEHKSLKETVGSLAASVGYLPTLQYLCESMKSELACNRSQLVFAAALNGRVEALRYLLSDLSDDDVKGGDNDQLCVALVNQNRERFGDSRTDYLGCLKLLRAKGYKWDVDALLEATDGLDCLMNIERYVKNPIARLWCVVNEDLEGKIAEDAFRRLKDLFDFYLMWDDEVRDLLVESMLRLQFDGVEHFFLPEWQVELIHNADIDDDDYNLILSRYKNLNQKEHRDEARRWWNTQLQSIMQVVDESVCGQVPDNVYKQLCEELKAVHDIVN